MNRTKQMCRVQLLGRSCKDGVPFLLHVSHSARISKWQREVREPSQQEDPGGGTPRMAGERHKGPPVPDDHRAAVTPAMDHLPRQSLKTEAIIVFCVIYRNPNLTHTSFKSPHAGDPRVPLARLSFQTNQSNNYISTCMSKGPSFSLNCPKQNYFFSPTLPPLTFSITTICKRFWTASSKWSNL